MRYRLGAALVVAGLLLTVMPVVAHHAVQAQFDQDKQLTITGTLTKVMWINPHVRWYLDVKDNSGKVTTWNISGAGPGGFRAIGITGRDVFKAGGTYTARIALARDGSNLGYIMYFVLPDGRKIDLWQQYAQEAARAAAGK